MDLTIPWETIDLVIFLLLAIVAEILGTIGGFGSSVFFVPLAAYFLGFHEALGLTAVFHVISNLTKISFFRHGIDKRLLIWLGIPSVIAVIAGAYLTSLFDGSKLTFYLGLLLMGIALLFLIKPSLKVDPSNRNALIGGTISGGTAGLLGTGGPIRGITLSSFNLSKEVFIATSAFIDLGVDLSRTVIYTSNGFVDFYILLLIPFLILVSVIGTKIGKRLLTKISQEAFKKIVLILILLIGIVMVIG